MCGACVEIVTNVLHLVSSLADGCQIHLHFVMAVLAPQNLNDKAEDFMGQ